MAAAAARRHAREEAAAAETGKRRRLLRCLMVVIDYSQAMRPSDFKPSRAQAAIHATRQLVRGFFAENPISYVGILITHNKTARIVSKPSSNGARHLRVLDSLERASSKIEGAASFVRSLQMSRECFRFVPPYTDREILVIHGALSSLDPVDRDVFELAAELSEEGTRCSFVGIAGEVYVAREVARRTGGRWGVAETEEQLTSLVCDSLTPPTTSHGDKLVATMELMGFPPREHNPAGVTISQQGASAHVQVVPVSHPCPRCSTRAASVPSQCAVCGLQLASA